eukprot:GHVS01056288.1.p1 GENE.GHVS01056288.1~~GHVS01056288.1.p1  ORF type:complete len:524 (-),score=59.98 GHVS01056288.1:355-1926(-)
MIFAGFHPHRYKLCSDGLVVEEEQLECLKEGPLEVSDCQPYRYLNKSFSIVSEWDLSQCTSPWFSAEVASSIFFFGFLVGVWLFGWLSDRLGRRTALCVAAALLQLGGLLICVSPSSFVYCMLRAVIGVGVGGQSIAGYVLAAELVSADYRQLVTLWGSMSFLICCLLLCIAVIFTPPSWRSLSFVASIPSLFLLLVWFTKYNIESPRWYATKGRMDEAQTVWQLIASVNSGSNGTVRSIHQTLPTLPRLERTKALEGGDREGLLDVVYTMPFQMWLAVMISMWFACSTLYYGGSLYLGRDAEHSNDGSDTEGLRTLAVTTIWCFLWEAVVTAASLVLADRLGRKAVTVGGLLVSGALCLVGYAVYFIPFLMVISHYAAVSARISSSTSFTVIYLYTAELFPTSVRGVTTGVSSVGARIAGILAPLVIKLDYYWPASPLMLFGLVGIASGLAGLLLPETLKRPLRNTLREESGLTISPRKSSHIAELQEVVGRPCMPVMDLCFEDKLSQMTTRDEDSRLSDRQ